MDTWTPAKKEPLNVFMTAVRGEFVVLDTETTDLEGEVCQIAIIDSQGETLLNTLVKPSQPISDEAMHIHGITNEAVATAPNWERVVPHIIRIITNQHVVTYNATFDRKMFHHSDEGAGIVGRRNWRELARWHCAMKAYAEFWGGIGARWQKLTVACDQQGIAVKDAHSALGDCLMTLALIRAMQAGPQIDS